MKRILYLLTLALLVFFPQAFKTALAKGDQNAGAPAQNQTPPQPDSQLASETIFPAPSKFSERFVGSIGKHAVRMKLERNGAALTGSYFYERTGAFNVVMRTLWLEGGIGAGGKVTLTETNYGTDDPKNTGEFKGDLDGMGANVESRLRFSGLWTGKDGKQLPFSLLQVRFDLGGPKIVKKKKKIASKKLNYEIETEAPQLAGAAPGLGEQFDRAVANLIAARASEFKKEASLGCGGLERVCKLGGSYEIKDADKDFISVLFSFDVDAGGIRPTTNYGALNYDLNRNARLKLADLFVPNSNYLKIISDYSIKELLKMGMNSVDASGAGPKLGNFHSWTIAPYGLDISFDRGQIVNWASREFGVVIPYSVLKPIIKPDGPLARFVK